MSLERYGQWLARGRGHQVEGRAIDALLCYRRALREVAGGADARFHLGEIAWQMGNPTDAITQWQAAIAAAPQHVASLHALADACASVGRFDAALDAVDRVLALRPGDARAGALATLLRAGREPVAAEALESALASGTTWPLGLLARIVDRAETAVDGGFPPRLREQLLDIALASQVTPASEDALRTIAFALAKHGDRDHALAFAQRYAESCTALHRSPMPLLWPLRSVGPLLRAGLLRLPDDPLGDVVEARLRDLFGADRCAWSLLTLGALPASPEAAARSIAALDLDVLIDTAGIAHPAGPLLALRPARTLWGLARHDIPSLESLVDRVFHFDELVAALAERHRALASAPGAQASAGELAAHWEAAVRAHQSGDASSARTEYDWVLERQPGHAPAHYLRAILERDQGATDAAVDGLRLALAAAPGFDDARAALANLLIDRGDPGGALLLVREGLAASANSAPLWRALGQADLKLGDAAGATAAFAEAIAREPDNAEAHYNHGVALQMQRDLAGAARAYQRALAFRPELDAAEFNLGVVFDQQGHADAAIAAFTNVLARAPGHVAAYKALGETLLATGRIDAWAANCERFEKHCPDHLAVAVQALEVCAYRGDYARLGRCLDDLRRERYTAGDPGEILDALQQLVYLLHFFDVEPGLIAGYERTHAELARRIYGDPWPRVASRRPGRLRIGYLSGDFRNHVMGKMMWEVLHRHDHARFEVFGYATTDAHDDWTERIRATFVRFDSVAPLSDDDAARRIAQDDLDLLVDLSTHTKGARPGILARKPARVQITHVASAGTTAMSAIDFKLTDRYADVEGDEESRSGVEGLLAMDGCVYPWRSIEPAPGEPLRRGHLAHTRRRDGDRRVQYAPQALSALPRHLA